MFVNLLSCNSVHSKITAGCGFLMLLMTGILWFCDHMYFIKEMNLPCPRVPNVLMTTKSLIRSEVLNFLLKYLSEIWVKFVLLCTCRIKGTD